MVEDAAQTTVGFDTSAERLEVFEGMQTLRFVLHAGESRSHRLREVFHGLLSVFLGSTALYILATRVNELSTFQLILAILALVGGGLQLHAALTTIEPERRFMEIEPVTLTVGTEPGGRRGTTRLPLSEVSNLRYVANWYAAETGQREAEGHPVPALHPDVVAKYSGIVCEHRGKPKALLLNLPRNTGDAILAKVYRRHPQLKPRGEA